MIDTRNRILEYSKAIFLKNGFYKTSMDELSIDLGMSKKTLYKYFESKSELVKEVVINLYDSLKEKSDKILMNPKIDTVEKLILLTKMNTETERLINEKWHSDIKLHEPKLQKYCEKFQNDSMNRISLALIRQGKKEQVIENYPSDLIIDSTNVLLRNLFSRDYIAGSKYSTEKIFSFIVNLMLNGLLTPKGKLKLKTIKKRRA